MTILKRVFVVFLIVAVVGTGLLATAGAVFSGWRRTSDAAGNGPSAVASGGAATAIKGRLRIVTFNIRHGEGLDGRVNLERIASVIEAQHPDVVLLQEVDRRTIRTGFKDEAAWLARRLGMNYVFDPTIRLFPGDYGNLLLTRLPILEEQNYALPGPGEARGLLAVALDLGHGLTLLVGGTHLGLSTGARASQLVAVQEHLPAPTPEAGENGVLEVLGGDFNTSSSAELAATGLSGLWRDTFVVAGRGPVATFGTRGGATGGNGERLDYIWASAGAKVLDSYVVPTDASDHNALVTDFGLPSQPSVASALGGE